jgi:ABC-type transporter Mla subunit MlaD
MPPMRGVQDLARLLQVQGELLSELPETLTELSRAVRGLADTVEASKATLASVQRVAERIDTLLDDLEDPVRGLRPGIEKVTAVLQDPAIQRIPPMLSSIDSTVTPMAQRAERTRARLLTWADSRHRLARRLKLSRKPRAGRELD